MKTRGSGEINSSFGNLSKQKNQLSYLRKLWKSSMSNSDKEDTAFKAKRNEYAFLFNY